MADIFKQVNKLNGEIDGVNKNIDDEKGTLNILYNAPKENRDTDRITKLEKSIEDLKEEKKILVNQRGVLQTPYQGKKIYKYHPS